MRPVPAPDGPAFAVILAGGSGRRLGLVDKPGLLLHGRRLVDIALAAVAPALTVVVGPDRELPPGTLQVLENPPGGGPAAALVAGLRALAEHRAPADREDVSGPGTRDLVVALASDLPGIDRAAVRALADAVVREGLDGAVLCDPDGRRQYLAGVWRWSALLGSVALRPSWHDARLSDLLAPLIGATVPVDVGVGADVDRPEDLIRWKLTAPESQPAEDGS